MKPSTVLAVVGVMLAAAGAPGRADPTGLVTAPAGWHSDPEQASALAQRFAAIRHLGGLRAVTAAEAYVGAKPGVALFVTRATAELSAATPPAARIARAALDELRASPQRTVLSGAPAHERSWSEGVERGARQVSANLVWDDPASHASVVARGVVASDGTRIVAVTGECITGEAAEPAAGTACHAALASLEPGVPVAGRTDLELAAAPEPGTGSTMSEPPRSQGSEPPRLGDGSKVTIPPMTISAAPPDTDRRPAYVGAGVLALAIGLWWNRRQRDRFEREDGRPVRRPRRARPTAHDKDDDDDGDDLHAAARGVAPDGETAPEARDDRPDRPDR